MNPKEDNLLSVSLSTKRLGIAVFSRAELTYFAVVTFKPPRTIENIKGQVSKAIRTLIEDFAPISIVIKRLGKHQLKSGKQNLVVMKIKREAEIAGIMLQEICFETV